MRILGDDHLKELITKVFVIKRNIVTLIEILYGLLPLFWLYPKPWVPSLSICRYPTLYQNKSGVYHNIKTLKNFDNFLQGDNYIIR